MKLLVLTEVLTDVNDKGKKRIDEALAKKNNRDDEAKSGVINKKWFEEQGLPVPPQYQDEKEEPEIGEDGFIDLEDDELEYVYFDLIVDLKQFIRAHDLEDFGSLVYFKDGGVVRVEEDTDEIFGQIRYLTHKPSVLEKITDWLKEKFRNKKNDLTLEIN